MDDLTAGQAELLKLGAVKRDVERSMHRITDARDRVVGTAKAAFIATRGKATADCAAALAPLRAKLKDIEEKFRGTVDLDVE